MPEKRVDNEEGPDQVGRDDSPSSKPAARRESVEDVKQDRSDEDRLETTDK
jgi:hypothetical protein